MMSAPVIPSLISKDNAQAVVELDQAVIDAVLRLSSLGLKPDGITDYCQKIVDGDIPSVSAVAPGPKALTIQAYSFLSDTSICVDKYGMSLTEAAEALKVLRTNPEEGRALVVAAVNAHQQAKNSPKPVVVTLSGLPSSKGGPKTGGDGGKSELAELMRRNQAIAGQYKFKAKEYGPDGPERFMVTLGGNIAVVGQNKDVAQKAASLVRVLGRRHQVLVKYVRLYVPGKPLASSSKIPDAAFNGVIAPDEAEPPNSNGNNGSTAG
nr:PAS-rich protein [Cladosporium cladosporioides polymycovirus 2]